MKIWSRRAPVRAVLAVAAAAVIAPTALAAIGPPPESRPPAVGAPGQVVAPADGASSTIVSRFRVFRSAPRTGDVPSTGVVDDAPGGAIGADIDRAFARSNGMDVRSARRLSATERVFAVPGRGVVCLVTGGGGATCTPDAHVGKDFQVQVCGAVPEGVVSVSGLVADSVDEVAIRQKGGGVLSVEPNRSFVDAHVPVTGDGDLPAAVELTSAGTTTSVPVSALALTDLDCEEGAGD